MTTYLVRYFCGLNFVSILFTFGQNWENIKSVNKFYREAGMVIALEMALLLVLHVVHDQVVNNSNNNLYSLRRGS